MALHKLSIITILMVICNIFATEEFMENPEDLPQVRDMDTNSPSMEIRQKRQAMEMTVSDLMYLVTPAPSPLRMEPTTEISNANVTDHNMKSYYIIDIDVTVSDIAMIDYLRNFLNKEQFPIVFNNDTELINANLTTVCHPNGTGFQCKCEEQFAWSYNSCVKYTPCDDIIDGTCGCINAVPSDGQFCHFKTSLDTPSYYIGDIDVTVSDTAMIDHLRNFLKEMQYPYNITTDTELITVNLTTVCYPNVTGFQCICEDQFAWSYNSCVTYTPCDDIIHDTCQCINAMPSDGQSCHIKPPSPTEGPTPAPVTTPTSPTKGPPPAPVTTPTSPTEGSTPAPLKPSNYTLNMSFKILRGFDEKLTDQSSSVFKSFKEDIERVLISNYQHINGFIQVKVLKFRNGSVITDLAMATNSVNSTEIATLDGNIAADLQALGYNTDPRSFSGVIYANVPFTKNFEIIYPGYTIELTCEVPESLRTGNGSWFVNGVPVSNNTKYTITNSPPKLTVKDMSIADNGLYNFTLTNYFLNFTHEETISVTGFIPPVIQLNQSSINVKCDNGDVLLVCCVTFYDISAIITQWVDKSTGITLNSSTEPSGTMTEKCTSASVSPQNNTTKTFTCQAKLGSNVTAQEANVTCFSGVPDCNDSTYGVGKDGSTSIVGCAANFTGNLTAVCENGIWNNTKDNCVFSPIVTLLLFSQKLAVDSNKVPLFVNDLNTTTTSFELDIKQSPATISTIVTILNNVANVSGNTSTSMMEDILETVSVLVSPDTNISWSQLNGNNTDTSSLLLESVENFTKSLSSDPVNITKPNIQLIKTTLTSPFNETLNSSRIFIPSQGLPSNTSITTIVFTTLDFVLPNRTNGNITNNFINGIVMLVYVNHTINNVSLTFDKTNKTNGTSHCVFWNFTVFNGTGRWDSTGCQLDYETNDSVTCSCSHLTSFSILMSPCPPNSPFLDYITYIGVGISMGCLVLCLIIEAFVWNIVTKNSTSHMRHVTIVNIALSLLIADIWFIIGAAVSGQSTLKNACSAATFFIHFFYLALFFWMLISALFLFYRTMMVFSHMSKRTMMAISFTVGYGAPLIIAIITIAVTTRSDQYLATRQDDACGTAPKNQVRKDDICWLNWDPTKALLAFVIPALVIVFVNLLILIVIVVKLLMRGVGENRQSEEKNALVVIARCVAVLTPIFGITWGFGIGTMVEPKNHGIQIVFTLFNSFQGFFILVFGTLIDSRIRSAIVGTFSFLPLLSTRTKSTSAGPSLSSLAGRIRRRGKNMYNVSSAPASQGSYEAFVNTDEPILKKF